MGKEEREYDKLFNEGVVIFDVSAEGSGDSVGVVLFSIYKIVFKHWSETMRMRMLEETELVEVTRRVEAFRSGIPKIVKKKDFEKLLTLLDEVQQSAEGRCRRSVIEAASDT